MERFDFSFIYFFKLYKLDFWSSRLTTRSQAPIGNISYAIKNVRKSQLLKFEKNGLVWLADIWGWGLKEPSQRSLIQRSLAKGASTYWSLGPRNLKNWLKKPGPIEPGPKEPGPKGPHLYS